MNDPKRILVVLLGFIVLTICALGIKGHMDSDGYKTQVKYTEAIQVTDAQHFNYAVDTQQGNLLTRGTFSTPFSLLTRFPEMTKGFIYVDRTEEHYTMHTYTTCSKRSCTTHVYYSWDEINNQQQYAKSFSFFGRNYNPQNFNMHNFVKDQSCQGITANNTQHGFFSSNHGCDGDDYYLDNDNRYTYSVVPQSFTATFLASSMGGGLHGSGENQITLQNKSISQVLKDVGKYKLLAFWVVTVIIILLAIVSVIGGYAWVMADGKWSLYE